MSALAKALAAQLVSSSRGRQQGNTHHTAPCSWHSSAAQHHKVRQLLGHANGATMAAGGAKRHCKSSEAAGCRAARDA